MRRYYDLSKVKEEHLDKVAEMIYKEMQDDLRKESEIKALLKRVKQYENGEFDYEQTLTLFQDLIDTGLAWKLQGHYGGTAEQMIEAGLCKPNINKNTPKD